MSSCVFAEYVILTSRRTCYIILSHHSEFTVPCIFSVRLFCPYLLVPHNFLLLHEDLPTLSVLIYSTPIGPPHRSTLILRYHKPWQGPRFCSFWGFRVSRQELPKTCVSVWVIWSFCVTSCNPLLLSFLYQTYGHTVLYVYTPQCSS